jgi:hypothetical protein
MEGSLEVAGRRGRRRKQVLDGLKEKKGYWKLEDEALDGTVWTGTGRGCGHIGQTTKKEYLLKPSISQKLFHSAVGLPVPLVLQCQYPTTISR